MNRLRNGLKPILVILNNDGYTIERLIHGKTAKYNDISSWNWQGLLDFFDASGKIPKRSLKAETRGQLEAILKDEEFRKADRCQLLEVKMGVLDAPKALIKQGELVSRLRPSRLSQCRSFSFVLSAECQNECRLNKSKAYA